MRITTFPSFDLVNNAGIYEYLPLEVITQEHFHKHFDLNMLGLILTSQQAAKYFGSAGGSIINISSLASTTTPATASVYSATKAAVDAVTKSLAKELGSRKIRVNSYQSWDGGNGGYTGSGSYWERLPKTD